MMSAQCECAGDQQSRWRSENICNSKCSRPQHESLPPPWRHRQRGRAAQWCQCLDLVPPSDSKGAAPTTICPFPATNGCKWNNPKQGRMTSFLSLPLLQLMHLQTSAMASPTRDLQQRRCCRALAGGGNSVQDQYWQGAAVEVATAEGSTSTGGSTMASATASRRERWQQMQGAISSGGGGCSGMWLIFILLW